MSRRKKTLKPRSILLIISVCAILCLAGLGYIWAKTEVYYLGKQMKSLEVKLDALRSRNEALQRDYATLCTPKELEMRIKRLNLGLVMLPPDQVIRLPEPVEPRASASETKVFASRTD
jgi:cell division protein FtsL